MTDVNKIVREILDTIDGVTVTFYHPGKFNTLPVISYYELTTTTGFCYDNAERSQGSNVAIDIWGRGGGECAKTAVKVDAAMQSHGWRRDMCRDLPPENNIYHKSMRFYKSIFYEEDQ